LKTRIRRGRGRGHVEVTRVADDDDVGVVLPAARQRPPRAIRASWRTPTDQLCRPQTSRWRFDDGDPARRRHDTTWVLRGDVRSYVRK
jgi:hypothetical protein